MGSMRACVNLPTQRDYELYFSGQISSRGKGPAVKYPYYTGKPVQKGGNIFTDVLGWAGRRLLPFVSFLRSDSGKKLGKAVARRLIDTTAKIATDKLSENGT